METTTVCCFPVQYEAFMLVSGGEAILMGEQVTSQFGYGYTNGSVQTAYDSINKRTYIHQDITSINSRYPGQPQQWNFIDIIHYEKRTRWRIYGDSSCEIYHDVMSPLWVECIPENATLVSRGRIGSRGEGVTYRFRHSIYLTAYELTVTVTLDDSNPGQCWPVSVTSSQSYLSPSNKNVDMTTAKVLDLTEGIPDERIFQPPNSCFEN
ncbi:hypothetical protein DPMN_026512 [Dreissena polymorpha]|uniref:Uncharacterized protein n=2 Tax=Dreissena polymorpha TaxID=45954 RepID=A0A9D4LTI6_DREPO|nr:hypothetical protein DPMN_026512 [Dreissena polymorpha]